VARLQAGLLAGDPAEQVDSAATLVDALSSCPIPELARWGRTLHAWRDELIAAFTNPDVSNRPTENLNRKIKNTKR
jgi:transposase